MHPDHIGLAHWLTERWTTPARECRLWISATDWNAARMASQSTTGFGGDSAARFFALPRPDRPRRAGPGAGAHNYYAGMVPQVPGRFRRLMDGMRLRIGGRAWRCIAGYGHAPEHIALHCAELGRADLRRHGAAAHLDQRQRDRHRARGQPAAAVPGLDRALARRCRPTRWCCPRTASPSPACTRASRSCRRTTTSASPRCCRPAPKRRAAPPTCCRCCSSASSTCTRPPSRWAKSIAHLHALVEAGRLQPLRGDDGVQRFRSVA